jgi:hypothetical protein
LLVSATNATNAYGYRFASSAYASPLANGVLPIGQPLESAALHVTYQVRSGSKPPPPQIDALAALAQVAQPAGDSFSINMTRLPKEPPPNPYQPNIDTPACTPEIVSYTRALLTELQSAAAVPFSGSRDYRLPSARETALGVLVDVHARAGFTAFTLNFQKPIASRAFISCVDQHFASIDEAVSLGLYVPATDASQKDDVEYFDARVGAYRLLGSVARQPSTGSQVDLLPVPVSSPAAPFAMRSTCPVKQRGFAQEILREFAKRFGRGGTPDAPSPYFKISAHAGSRATWWSIHFTDPLTAQTLLQCGEVSGALPADLSTAGVGAETGALNFAARLGLYQAVPAP